MGSVSLEVTGVNELKRGLDDWAADVANLKAPFTSMLQELIRPKLVQTFASSGPGWKALSPAYAKWKELHYAGAPILVRTGKMRTALTGGVGSSFVVTENSLTIDPSQAVPYWKAHEAGTSKLPKRSMLNFDAQAQSTFAKYIEDWLVQRAYVAGLSSSAST